MPGVNNGRGGYFIPTHLLVPWLRKSRAIPLHPLRLFQSIIACTRGYRDFPRRKKRPRGLFRPHTPSAVVKKE